MEIENVVKKAFARSFDAMTQRGFPIGGEVQIGVDPNLPIMGYTYTKDGVHAIVVSEFAVTSGLLDGLLVHEMSHIYMGEAKHPSHDDVLVEGVVKKFREGDYRDRVLHEIVNHVKNIYADDVAFKVFKDWQGAFSGETARKFFLNWIKTEPIALDDPTQSRWMNGSIMVSNAFAVGTATRHGYFKGFEEEFTARNAEFLNRVDGELAENFDYFKRFFANLEAETSASLFRRRLSDFLKRFIAMAEDKP